MELKGFYFSLDAILGLAIIGLTISLITLSMDTGLTESEIRFSDYGIQAIDIGYMMQYETLKNLSEDDKEELIDQTSFEDGDLDRSIISAIMILEEEGNSYSEQLAESYLSFFRHETGLYYREDSELKAISELEANTTSAASFATSGNERPYEIVVVVGE